MGVGLVPGRIIGDKSGPVLLVHLSLIWSRRLTHYRVGGNFRRHDAHTTSFQCINIMDTRWYIQSYNHALIHMTSLTIFQILYHHLFEKCFCAVWQQTIARNNDDESIRRYGTSLGHNDTSDDIQLHKNNAVRGACVAILSSWYVVPVFLAN